MNERIENHPQYTDADLAYLKGKGYSDEQVLAFWDRDLAQGKAPVTVNKHDPATWRNEASDRLNALIDAIHQALWRKDPNAKINMRRWRMQGRPEWLCEQLQGILDVLNQD